MKKFFQILTWAILLLATIAAVAFAEINHRQTACNGFDLLITGEHADPLIEAAAIKAKVLSVTDTLTGKKISDIDLHRINEILEDNPYVSASDIQTDISGKLTIEVSLRRAVIRVVNNNGYNYYIDTEGWLMPINPGHPSRVIIANGSIKDGITDLSGKKIHIKDLSEDGIAGKLHKMAIMIDQSPFLRKLITQIYVKRNGELEIIPVLGNYTVKFGNFNDMERKFNKLKTFYREGAGKAGWINYRSIDLRYENQIICSKK